MWIIKHFKNDGQYRRFVYGLVGIFTALQIGWFVYDGRIYTPWLTIGALVFSIIIGYFDKLRK